MAAIALSLVAIFLMKPTEALALLADLVPQGFDKRSTASGGGWALSQGSCPPSSTACSSGWCCPDLLTCNHLGNSFNDNVCCPGTTQCVSAFQAIPLCADNTWTLWNATTVPGSTNNFFCCLPGQTGLRDGTCVSADTVVASTLSAISLVPSATAAPPQSSTKPTSASTPTSTSTPSGGAGGKSSGLSASTIGAIIAGSVVGFAIIVSAILYATNTSFKNAVNKWIASLGSSQGTTAEGGGGTQATATTDGNGIKKKHAYDTAV